MHSYKIHVEVVHRVVGINFWTFHGPVFVFLNHFHLLVQYAFGTDLLLMLRKEKSTHIYDHIQEWHL